MKSNQLVWIGLFIGSTVGGLVPSLWGAGMLSMSGVVFSAIGGIVGIYCGFKLNDF